MKRLPIGIQSFRKIITEEYIYIDKTESIYQLITGGQNYFLSRPRRFGKSLLISTLKEIFLNNKNLFAKLWIGSSDYEWKQYSVIHIDFSRIPCKTAADLEQGIIEYLKIVAYKYQLDIGSPCAPESALERLVVLLAERHKVVILVDEYDYSLLTSIQDKKLIREHQRVLRNFFTVIKSLDVYIHFVFLTGVTKIWKTVLFSGLNNVQDITLDVRYATLLGYTQEEVVHYFKEHLDNFAKRMLKTPRQLLHDVQSWYDGYQMTRKPSRVYNPFSVLLYIDTGYFSNYWFESATPQLVMNLITSCGYPLEHLHHAQLHELDMATHESRVPLVPFLLQTGYLTIVSYDTGTGNYRLGYPNKEVKVSFLSYFLKHVLSLSISYIAQYIERLSQALASGDVTGFCSILQQFFMHIPSSGRPLAEYHFSTLFYALSELIGTRLSIDITVRGKKIKTIIRTKGYVYVIDFKVGSRNLHRALPSRAQQDCDRFLERGKTTMAIDIIGDTSSKNRLSFKIHVASSRSLVSGIKHYRSRLR